MMIEQAYTKTPNAIYSAIPKMNESELKVTMALVRGTYGYHRDWVRATYDDLMTWTGLSRQAVSDGIKAVKERGFFAPGEERSTWIAVSEVDQNSLNNRREEIEEQSTDKTETVNQVDRNSQPSRPPQSSPKERKERERKERERKNGTRAPNAFWEIPDSLQKEAFIKAWKLWLDHVDESGLTFTETQATVKLQELEGVGPDVAASSIMTSLSKGWRNIFVNGQANGVAANMPSSMRGIQGV